MSNSEKPRLSLNLMGQKTPVDSSKRTSVPAKLTSVAGGSSSPRTLANNSQLHCIKSPCIKSPSTKSGSGGGPSVTLNSPASNSLDKSTPPTPPPRGGTAAVQGKVPANFVFSAKTCLELLPSLTVEQLNFELTYFQSMGCQFDHVITRSSNIPRKNIVKLIADALKKERNSQYQAVLQNFNEVFSSISRLTEDAETYIREMQPERESPPATPPTASPDTDHAQVSQEAPAVNFDDQVFSFIQNINFNDMTVDEILRDLDVDQPASCGRKVRFYGNTDYSYGTVKHEPTPYHDCPTFHLLFDRISAVNPHITRDTHSCLVTLYPNGRAYIPEHQDNEHKIVPGSQIYTVSVGGPRSLRLINKVGMLQEQVIKIPHGSIHTMSADSQHTWAHEILPDPLATIARISFTFRHLDPSRQPSPSPPIPPIEQPKPVLPSIASGSHKRILFLTDSILSSTPSHLLNRIQGYRSVKKTNYELADIFGFEPEFQYSDMVVISCGLNDLSRYGKRAHVLADLVTRRFSDCCRRNPDTTFVFNSILLTSYGWLNEEITEFNRIMFELSFQHSNMIFFDSHEALMRSQLIPGGVIERRKEYGGNGCHLTFAAKRLVTSELISGLTCLAHTRSDQTRPRKLQQWEWPIRTVFDNVYRDFAKSSKVG